MLHGRSSSAWRLSPLPCLPTNAVWSETQKQAFQTAAVPLHKQRTPSERSRLHQHNMPRCKIFQDRQSFATDPIPRLTHSVRRGYFLCERPITEPHLTREESVAGKLWNRGDAQTPSTPAGTRKLLIPRAGSPSGEVNTTATI